MLSLLLLCNDALTYLGIKHSDKPSRYHAGSPNKENIPWVSCSAKCQGRESSSSSTSEASKHLPLRLALLRRRPRQLPPLHLQPRRVLHVVLVVFITALQIHAIPPDRSRIRLLLLVESLRPRPRYAPRHESPPEAPDAGVGSVDLVVLTPTRRGRHPVHDGVMCNIGWRCRFLVEHRRARLGARLSLGPWCSANLRSLAWTMSGEGRTGKARSMCGILEQAAGPEMKCEHVVNVAVEGWAGLGAVDSVVACWPRGVDDCAGCPARRRDRAMAAAR